MVRRIAIAAAVGACVAAVAAGPGAAADPGIAPPQSHPLGMSYADWQAGWWGAEALFYTDLCGEAQSGQVRFLAAPGPGSYAATCTVSTATWLLLPVAGYFCEPIEAGSADPDVLRQCATAGYDGFFGAATLTLALDGRSVRDLTSYRTVTPVVDTEAFGPLVSDGIFVMLSPLSVGSHELVLHGQASGATFDETFTIVVAPPA